MPPLSERSPSAPKSITRRLRLSTRDTSLRWAVLAYVTYLAFLTLTIGWTIAPSAKRWWSVPHDAFNKFR